MSRKPQTPRTDDTPAGTGQKNSEIPHGRRFSGNDELLRFESELLADGIELANRAIPVGYHTKNRSYDRQEITEIIESELEKTHPNRQLIGYLNEVEV